MTTTTRTFLNLASRPFVNRWPHVILLGLLAALAVALCTWNAAVVVRARRAAHAAESQLREMKGEETRLRERRQQLLSRLAAVKIEPLTLRVDAVNAVLAERAVSWTLLLKRLEQVLPWAAALQGMGTRVSPEGVVLDLDLRVKTYEDGLRFIEELEKYPCFSDVYPVGETETDSHEFDVRIEAQHDPYCGERPKGAKHHTRRPRRAGARRG